MSISKRAFRVTFAALMLALASHASAVGLSAATTTPVADSATDQSAKVGDPASAPSERQQQVNRSKSNIKNNKLSSDAPVNAVPTTTGQPADGKVKGKVTPAQDTGMLGKAAPQATPAACADQPKGSEPSTCPKGIQESGIK